MSSQAFVKTLRTTSELEDIREAWEAWPGNRDSEMDSYLTFLESSPNTLRPHVLVVYREGRPDSILVGRIDRGQIACRVGYLNMNFSAQILCFVYGALRGNPSEENCDLMLSEILRSLSQGEADTAYMNFLNRESDLCRLAMKKPSLLSRDYVRLSQPHFTATLPATAEEFYQRLSPKVRKTRKWQAKKFINDFSGEVRIHCYREVKDLDKMIQDVEQVAKKSYQRGLGVGFVDTPTIRNRLVRMAEKGWLRAYVLYVLDRPCAFWIGDINQNTFGSDFLAFDAELGKYSPGIFLITKVIEGFCDGNREGVTAVDFATGYAQYKEMLSNQKSSEISVYIFAPSLKGIGLNGARSLILGVDQTIKKILARTDLLQKIKRRWRAHARPKEATQG